MHYMNNDVMKWTHFNVEPVRVEQNRDRGIPVENNEYQVCYI